METHHLYSSPGTSCEERMIAIDPLVSLRVISFHPLHEVSNPSIVMIVGLASQMESFGNLLIELTKDHTIHFIDTREKASSILKGNVKFDIETMGQDLLTILDKLNVQEGNYILMGYSFGAAVILDAYRTLRAKPQAILLMEPTPAFHYPKWSLSLIRFAVPLYPILKPTAKWYLRNFHINTRVDKEMALISSRALDNAVPFKLKNAILSIAKYTAWHTLGTIDCASLIVATSKDGLHSFEDTMRLVKGINNCEYIDMETNDRTHSAEMGILVRNYIRSKKTVCL